jgi:hypothetical protein
MEEETFPISVHIVTQKWEKLSQIANDLVDFRVGDGDTPFSPYALQCLTEIDMTLSQLTNHILFGLKPIFQFAPTLKSTLLRNVIGSDFYLILALLIRYKGTITSRLFNSFPLLRT